MNDANETENAAGTSEGSPADETFGWTDADGETESSGPAHAAREVMSQIQSAVGAMAEKAGPVARDLQARAAPVARDLVERATPVAREIGARAAGLAAVAGEKAGPIAHKAAEMTADAGVKLAERSRGVADDLRHAASGNHGDDAAAEAPSDEEASA